MEKGKKGFEMNNQYYWVWQDECECPKDKFYNKDKFDCDDKYDYNYDYNCNKCECEKYEFNEWDKEKFDCGKFDDRKKDWDKCECEKCEHKKFDDGKKDWDKCECEKYDHKKFDKKHGKHNKKKECKFDKCSINILEYLVDEYLKTNHFINDKLEAADCNIEKVVRDLHEVAEIQCQADTIGEKIDEWLENCLCKYEVEWPDCKCDKIRSEFHEMKKCVCELTEEASKMAKKLEEKIDQIICLVNEKDETLDKIIDKCYPDNDCDCDC